MQITKHNTFLTNNPIANRIETSMVHGSMQSSGSYTTQQFSAICIVLENKAEIIVHGKIKTMGMRRRVWEVILSCWISNCSNRSWDIFNSIYWVSILYILGLSWIRWSWQWRNTIFQYKNDFWKILHCHDQSILRRFKYFITPLIDVNRRFSSCYISND